MNLHQTGLSEKPTILDLSSVVSMWVTDFIRATVGFSSGATLNAATMEETNGEYDAATMSYEGIEGLRYRVPLSPLPSERHCRERIANIKVLCDNVRKMCLNDDLPSTPEEKKFWASYRFIKYQVFFAPFSFVLPPVYLIFRAAQHRLPFFARGRMFPVSLAAAIAEQIAESTFPAHNLLATALKQKTPLGDAARAEWQRLQPVSIPFHIYTAYQVQTFFGSTPEQMLFGGDAATYCNT